MQYKKILIYSPNIGGHRQVYCNVIANWALESDLEIFLYVGNNWCTKDCLNKQSSPYIEIYRNNPDVSIITKEDNSLFRDDLELLSRLEHELNPDISFVISGDEFNISSLSILKSCIKRNISDSKRIGIFISCYGYQYPKNWLKYTFLKLRLKQKIKYFDIKYWLDEYFVKNTSIDSSIWLPDISKSFNVGDSIEDSDDELLCGQIDDFLNNNEEKEILLFFGRDFIRKGFDYLLELALDDDRFAVLRAGDSLESDENQDIIAKMEYLENSGRLLNIAKFIKSPLIIKKMFCATNFIPLPYRDHYNSSGVMLQAMEFNKPVIVPNVGLMGKRVIESNLGMVYYHKNYDSFKESVYRMQKECVTYTESISSFYSQFSKYNIFKQLDIILNDNE